MNANIRINRERFLRDFAELSEFGATPDGLAREAGSEAYFRARDFLREKMELYGLETVVDAAGNLFGSLKGSALHGKSCKRILSGSHLDSVTDGGVYDGPLGIISALEVLKTLQDSGYKNRHTLEVAAFNAEEGGPLGGTFGSRVFAGILDPGDVSDEVLDSYGMNIDELLAAKGSISDYAAFLEVHIEQGPVLWNNGISIGVPTGIVGISRYSVVIGGAANHAGTTPMKQRRDAMQTAARLLDEWFKWAVDREDFVCNVGTFKLEPGHVSIVPSGAHFVLELRSLSLNTMREAALKFKSIAGKEDICTVKVNLMGEKHPIALNNAVIETICSVCEESDISFIRMPSGASHDSAPMALIMPAGMIFVPSANGISHSKEEHTTEDDMVRGAECLLGAILKLDCTDTDMAGG